MQPSRLRGIARLGLLLCLNAGILFWYFRMKAELDAIRANIGRMEEMQEEHYKSLNDRINLTVEMLKAERQKLHDHR